MLRLLFAAVMASCCATSLAADADVTARVLAKLDRTLTKEPTYRSTPKYSLMLLGANGDVKVWMVEDGKRLYVDKNANGDLTDDGPPIEPSDVRSMGNRGAGGDHWDFNYVLAAITPPDGLQHTHFNLRRWNYGAEEDSYGLSLSVGDRLPMYAGWFGTFWSAKAKTAPVIHFGGPVTPKMLRYKEFTVGSGSRRLSVAFTNPGSDAGAVSRLSIDALAANVVPKLNIEWPTAGGGPPLQTSHGLFERCCYWEFYTTVFKVPPDVAVGVAKVSVELPAGAMPIALTTTEIDVPVVAKPKNTD
jgi:hypothetical protein